MLKQLFAAFGLAGVLSITACGGGGGGSSSAAPASTPEPEKIEEPSGLFAISVSTIPGSDYQDITVSGDTVLTSTTNTVWVYQPNNDNSSSGYRYNVCGAHTLGSVEIEGTLAIINAFPKGPFVYDISDPSAIDPVYTCPSMIKTRSQAIAVENNVVYLFERGNAVDSDAFAAMNLQGFINGFAFPYSVNLNREGTAIAANNQYAYVLSIKSAAPNQAQLSVFDLSSPLAPSEIATLNVAASAKIDVKDGVAYILGHNTIEIVDVSNPLVPVQKHLLSVSFSPTDIAFGEGFALISSNKGIQLLENNNDSVPVITRSFGESVAYSGVGISGKYGYAIAGDSFYHYEIKGL